MKHVLLIPSCNIGPSLNELNPNDTLPRLQKGLILWKQGGYDTILVTGGVFNAPSVQIIPAAVLMKKWLIAHGVPAANILCENESLDTYENIANGLAVLKRNGLSHADITIVTQWQHAIRCWLTFRRGYRKTIRIVPLSYPISFRTWCWEFLFIIHHLLFPKGKYSPFAARNRSRRSNSNASS